MGRRVFVTNEVTGVTLLLLDMTLAQAAQWCWLRAHEYIHGPMPLEKAPFAKAPATIAQPDGNFKCSHWTAAVIPPARDHEKTVSESVAHRYLRPRT